MGRRISPWFRFGLPLVLALACIAALTVYLRNPREEEQKVRVGYIPFSADLPFFVAVDAGYFKEEGLDVEPVRFNEGSEATTALLAGQVDVIAPIAYSIEWPALQQDPDAMRMFIPVYETKQSVMSAMLVKPDSPIRSADDLRGKKVGTYSGVPQLLYLKLTLRGLGLDPDKDVTVLQVAGSLQVTALETGQFDVLFTTDPFITIAKEKVGARVVIANPRARYIVDPFPMGAAVVSKVFLGKRPGDVKRVYRAMARGVTQIRTDPAGAKAVLPRFTAITPDLAPKTEFYEAFTLDDEPDLAAVQKLADIMHENRLLERKIDARSMFLTAAELK